MTENRNYFPRRCRDRFAMSREKNGRDPTGGRAGAVGERGTENRRSSRHLRRLRQRPRIAVSRGAAPRDRRLVTLGRDISH